MLVFKILLFLTVAAVAWWGFGKYYQTIRDCYREDAETRKRERESKVLPNEK
ncbi:hypothetical protein K2X33_02075 [bacterium]|nr:hypothetical protein [bacterium]